MKAANIAVFPLALVQNAMELRGKGSDPRLQNRFGYIRAKRMYPAVHYWHGGLERTHCGSYPLVGYSGIHVDLRFGNVCRGCYINTVGGHVYPG